MSDVIFGTINPTTNINIISVYVNQYAIQNVRELPGAFEMHGTHPLMREPEHGHGLGCIWFTDLWNHDRSKLYVDADQEWEAFMDIIADIVEDSNIKQVLFYWP